MAKIAKPEISTLKIMLQSLWGCSKSDSHTMALKRKTQQQIRKHDSKVLTLSFQISVSPILLFFLVHCCVLWNAVLLWTSGPPCIQHLKHLENRVFFFVPFLKQKHKSKSGSNVLKIAFICSYVSCNCLHVKDFNVVIIRFFWKTMHREFDERICTWLCSQHFWAI